MGLLDNLFKPKPESGVEKSVENSAIPETAEAHAPATISTGAPSQKASPFLAPKNYAPRSSMQIVPPTRNQLQAERKPSPLGDPPPAPKEITLTLGDVLSQIPTHFLRQGALDLRRELRFPAEPIAAEIARGRPAVSLAAIAAQCADLFVPDANGLDAMQIRLPLQKLVEQISPGPVSRTPIPPPPLAAAPAPAPAPAPPLGPNQPAAEDPKRQSEASTPAAIASASLAEEQIHLNLSAILKRCPPEIIVQPLPPIDESVRITFPFAPIERQLATGQVEVSSLRFIAALPLGLMKCFEARAGVRVPLPLEEIFQNLPNQAPPASVETRHSTPPPPEILPASEDPARENARLAEGILLEMEMEIEPSRPAVALVPPHIVERTPPNAEPVSKVEAPVDAPAPTAAAGEPVIDTPFHKTLSEPEKAEAVMELAAQLEALAAEDARIESQREGEADTVTPNVAPAEETTSGVPAAILPHPLTPADDNPAEVPAANLTAAQAPPVDEQSFEIPAAILPGPDVSSVETSAFRPFVPALRPVILQPTVGHEELSPSVGPSEPPAPLPPESAPMPPQMQAPPAAAPEAPRPQQKPPQAFQPPPEAIPPAPASVVPAPAPVPPPPSVLRRPPAPPPAEPAFVQAVAEPSLPASETPAPVTENSPPAAAAEPGQSALRIGPPQFRPFVVQAPPIVLAPTSDGGNISHSPPEASEHGHPEPKPEVAPASPHEQSESVAFHADAVPDAPSPPAAISEPASPFLLDGLVRVFFASDAPLAMPRVSQLLAALPGIQGCVLVARSTESCSGELPNGLDSSAILDLSQRMRGALPSNAGAFDPDRVQHLTLHADDYSLSFFTRGDACVCAVHRARIFLPGVRERFAAVAEELARVS